MKREFHPPHLYEDNTCYFVTASIAHHHRLLDKDAKRDLVSDVLKEAVPDYGITLYAWVILSDHYHLLLKAGEVAPLFKFIKRLHGDSAIRLNKLDGAPGRMVWFQYWDRFPRSEADFWGYFNYILLNPIKHGHVRLPAGDRAAAEGRLQLTGALVRGVLSCLADYRQSSYHYYVRTYGEEFLYDALLRYPVPDYTGKDDFYYAGPDKSGSQTGPRARSES